MHTYMPANSVFDGPVTNPLSVLCIVIEFPSHAHAKGGSSQNDFIFGTSVGHSPRDRVASMAVKGLKCSALHSYAPCITASTLQKWK